MSGYYVLIAQCGGCGRTFSANPERVPCYPVDLKKPVGPPEFRLSSTGTKEPFCKDCFEAIQHIRDEHGLERQTAMRGAWDETEAL